MSEGQKNKYLFILTPPFCGSTLLWKTIGTSPAVSSLSREGQQVTGVWHVMPGTKLVKYPEMEVPWKFVKKKWKRKWNLEKTILLEKSTSSIHRADKIKEHFNPISFVALIRDPYAFCEGVVRRGVEHSWAEAARLWVKCAKSQRWNVIELSNVIQVRYEDFTDRTEDTIRAVVEFVPELKEIKPPDDSTATVLGPKSEIENINEEKTRRLTPKNISSINYVLSKHRNTVSFFDYKLRDPSEHSSIRAWGARFSTFAVRGLRWMARNQMFSSILAEKIEKHVRR